MFESDIEIHKMTKSSPRPQSKKAVLAVGVQ